MTSQSQDPKKQSAQQNGGDHYNPGGQAGESIESAGQHQSGAHPKGKGGEPSKPIGNYNPGGQAGESVESGGQRPADEQRKPGHGGGVDR
ncbi:MAG: hypothetical protein WCG92_22335 [Hyphomicrobiales bacterium]|nr:hypothetical protein [Alphaproteobacteria bacterium]